MIANPHNTYLPGLESVSYPPKVKTVAVKVTRENIGALSIEFASELLYFQNNGEPFFYVDLQRTNEDGTPGSVRTMIRIGDWLVVLWDEYRVFREAEFSYTFRLNAVPSHELEVDHSSGQLPEFLAEGATPELKDFDQRINDISRP